MERTVLWGWPWRLLLLLWVSGFQAIGQTEKQICLTEGRNLTIRCIYNINLFASSLKAWQRVRSQGPPETLVYTNTRNKSRSLVQAGRYLLEDDPTNAGFIVTVTELQRQDLGLYQCVIDLNPKPPHVLFPRIRLVLCEDPGMPPDGRSNILKLVIALTCAFILNKGLVFSVLFVLVQKAWASGEANPGKQENQATGS